MDVLSIAVVLAAPLAAGQSPDVRTLSLDAAQLARAAGVVTRGERFVLGPRERAELELCAPIAFRSVGVLWRGELGSAWIAPVDASGAELALVPVTLAADVDPGDGRRASALAHAYERDGESARLRLEGPLAIEELALVAIARGAPPDPSAGPEASPDGGSHPKPPVYSRAQWGAYAPTCGPVYCNTTHVGVHHSASVGDGQATSWSQCAGNVQSIQAYHMFTNGWCDIGYNYLACRHGDLFEGRAGGDDVKGAHDGWNCGSMGVCLLGYYHPPYNQVPAPAMLDSLVELGAWKCSQQSIAPSASGWYAGYGGVMSNVYGHRDVTSTACPGDLAYAQLPSIRTQIEQALAGGGVEIVLDNPQAVYSGTWTLGTSAPDKFGPDYRWASTGQSGWVAYWTPSIPTSGQYTVYLWWSAGANRNPATRVGVRTLGTTHVATVNQQQSGGQWNAIGTYTFAAGTQHLIGLSAGGDPGWVVIADALRLVKN